jgi:hypothetical protein
VPRSLGRVQIPSLTHQKRPPTCRRRAPIIHTRLHGCAVQLRINRPKRRKEVHGCDGANRGSSLAKFRTAPLGTPPPKMPLLLALKSTLPAFKNAHHISSSYRRCTGSERTPAGGGGYARTQSRWNHSHPIHSHPPIHTLYTLHHPGRNELHVAGSSGPR